MLTPADLQMFQTFGIGPNLLQAANVDRISDAEARSHGFRRGRKSDLSGLR